MKKINITLVKPSDFQTDPRIIKESKTIVDAGHEVNFICMSETVDSQISENINIYNFKKKVNININPIAYWPFWWIYEFYSLLHIKTNIFHILNYNSILPALIVGKIRNIPVIYEIMDTTYDAIKIPCIIRNFIIFIDKIHMKYSDAIILVDECQIRQFSGIPNSNVYVIYDSPIDIKEFENKKNKVGANFVMVYIGVLFKIRHLNIDILCDIVKKIDGVQLIIAGYGDLVDEIIQWGNKSEGKIKFLGRIPYSEALKINLTADCLVVLRDSNVNTNKYICGSKLWESMMCGKPIIVNNGTSTAVKVRKENCGLVADVHNPAELEEKIILMRDDVELCRNLGENGRRAYEERYGWNIMEKRLLELYEKLTDKIN